MRSINNNAPVKFSKTILIDASPSTVWAVLTAIEKWPAWNPEISEPKVNGPLQQNTTFNWKSGGGEIHSILHTVDPLKYFGWTGESSGLYAIHNWTLTEINGQTNLTSDESIEGLNAEKFKTEFNKNIEKGTQKWLELLKAESEKAFQKIHIL